MSDKSDIQIVDAIIEKASIAQLEFEKNGSQKAYDMAAQAVGWAIMEPSRNKELAELAVLTTGLGNVKDKIIKNVAEFNSALQGAYFIIAARSIGLDCCPMLGFNKETLNHEFFPDNKNKAIFICGIGYGDDSKLRPRAPRLNFEEACNII